MARQLDVGNGGRATFGAVRAHSSGELKLAFEKENQEVKMEKPPHIGDGTA